jgi:(R,R)-butanediol dehydrogenase/meso-butanediol dehydrogenase/diacetyl reductase
VLLKVAAASLCGTDVSEFDRGPIMVPLHGRHRASGHHGPTILGHEFTGTVVDVGAGVDPGLLGHRVVPGAGHWCTRCARCAEGRPNLCNDYYLFGIHTHGGMAEMASVPASMCHRVPEGCADTDAAIAQPLAVALHAVRRSRLGVGETAVVIGVGGIGAFVLAAAAARKPGLLIAVDINAERATRALTLGADLALDARTDDVTDAVRTAIGGADVVYEAAGRPETLRLAISLTRPGGRVQMIGIQPAPVTLDLHDAVVGEINLLSSNGHICGEDLPEALALLEGSELGTQVIGHTIGLSDVSAQGLAAMADGKTNGKVVVRIRPPDPPLAREAQP